MTLSTHPCCCNSYFQPRGGSASLCLKMYVFSKRSEETLMGLQVSH